MTLPPSFGSFAVQDFETSNPGLAFQDARLTHLAPAAAGPLTPGQTASVHFSLTQGVKEVLLVYASTVDTSQQVLTWQGTASPGRSAPPLRPL